MIGHVVSCAQADINMCLILYFSRPMHFLRFPQNISNSNLCSFHVFEYLVVVENLFVLKKRKVEASAWYCYIPRFQSLRFFLHEGRHDALRARQEARAVHVEFSCTFPRGVLNIFHNISLQWWPFLNRAYLY